MNLLEQSTRGLVLCALLGVATMALAECDNSPNSPGELHVCKPWPAEDGINIGVRASPMQGAENAKVPRYNLDVALLLDDSGWAVASYNKDLARRSDGLALQGLQIDTGRYQLSEEERAFGLRATYRRASSTHPHEKTVLTLFVRDGKGLPPRLEGLVVDERRAELGRGGECVGRSRTLHRTLELGNGQRNGHADLLVRTRIVDTEHFKGPAGCESRDLAPRDSRVTLHYDGQRYPLPKTLTGA
ncbi:hypothetical protein PEQA60_14720 [Pseudomonas sp. Eqa60]|uniref:hypothetical protein n=1 Tax=unclassified Pseudomonas TaxID=196821 RepID=UPI001BB3569B|nr:hypothetical protein [Pseudomonas sp. Eqa60]BCQ67482.1 hypothetical protein PEQA60_14720 [Pseudomonas sp. Eqa60]